MNSIQRQPRSRIFESDSQTQSQRPITPSQQQSSNQNNYSKVRHLTHNTQFNTPIVQCHYHPEQFIQNFCKHLDCLLPLCPQCVTIHQEDHNNQFQTSTFDHLATCLAEQQNKIVDICNLLANDMQNITDLTPFINDHYKTQKSKFIEAKESFYKQIDNYFQTLENTFNIQSTKQIDYLLNQVNQFYRLAFERWNNMQTRLQKLNSDKCLKTLIKCYKQSKPEDIYSQQHETSLQFIDQIKVQLEKIQINPTQLQHIIDQLHSYIEIVTEQQQQQQQQFQPSPQQVKKIQRPNSQQHVASTSPINARMIKAYPIQQGYIIPNSKIIPQIQQGILLQQPGINYYDKSVTPVEQKLSNIPLPFPTQSPVIQLYRQQKQSQIISNPLQPLIQIQDNKIGEVFDLKQSRNPQKLSEQYKNRIFNENDFSPKLNIT